MIEQLYLYMICLYKRLFNLTFGMPQALRNVNFSARTLAIKTNINGKVKDEENTTVGAINQEKEYISYIKSASYGLMMDMV